MHPRTVVRGNELRPSFSYQPKEDGQTPENAKDSLNT